VDLISTAGFGSDGSGRLGARGGGAVTPATKSRGIAARGLPDFTVQGAPGVKSTGLWVWCDQRVMRDLPRAKAGLGGALGCARGGGGGSACIRAVLGIGAVANGCVRMRSA
jgi:hypothetical protein